MVERVVEVEAVVMMVGFGLSDGAFWLLSRTRSGGRVREGTGLGVLGVNRVGALGWLLVGGKLELAVIGRIDLGSELDCVLVGGWSTERMLALEAWRMEEEVQRYGGMVVW